MSVDFYSCELCGEAVYDEFGEYCEKCGRWICNNCSKEGDLNDNAELLSTHCPFCNGSKVHSDDLIDYILSQYAHKERSEVEQEYRKVMEVNNENS